MDVLGYLHFLSGNRKGVHLPLHAGRRMVFGRDPSCDFVLSEADISSRHMLLEGQAGVVRILDLDSKNGVFVNNRRVKTAYVKPGDMVRLGASVGMRLEPSRPLTEVFREGAPLSTRVVHRIEKDPDRTAAIKIAPDSTQRLHRLVDISHLIHEEIDTQRLLQRIVGIVQELFSPDRAYIVLRDKSGDLKPAVFQQMTAPAQNLPISSTILQRVVEDRSAVLTQDAISDDRFRAGQSIVIGGIRSAMCVPLETTDKVIGAVYMDTVGKPNRFTKADLSLLSAIAHQAAVALQRAQLLEKVERAYYSTVRVMIASVEAKDEYTRGHSERVTSYAMRMADYIGLAGKRLDTLRLAALLHDIGKIGVPDKVLKKPGRLTEEEFNIIRKHPEVSYKIIRAIDSDESEEVALIARAHHERYDGKGYPMGTAGKKIPIFARIIAVCDTYDAMTSHRPYRPPLPKETVLRELKNGAGSQFDPRIAALMARLIEQGEISPL